MEAKKARCIDVDSLAVIVGLRFMGEKFKLESRARSGLSTAEARKLEWLRAVDRVLDKAAREGARPFHSEKDSPL